MGTLSETEIVHHRLTFANQKKTNFCFPFPFAANKLIFAVSIFCLQQKTEIGVFH
jgi:hypothetical protein